MNRRQTKIHSIIEQIVHTSIGFAITLICISLFFPDVPLFINLQATGLMTVVKFVVHFGVRRLFTNYTYRRIKKMLKERRDEEI